MSVSMDGIGRECRKADGNVFRGLVGSGIPDPFSRMRYDGLPGPHFKLSLLVLDPEPSPQDDGVLFEFRCLPGLLPSGGAAHMGYAEAFLFGIQPANIFINDLGHVAR